MIAAILVSLFHAYVLVARLVGMISMGEQLILHVVLLIALMVFYIWDKRFNNNPYYKDLIKAAQKTLDEINDMPDSINSVSSDHLDQVLEKIKLKKIEDEI